MTKEAAFYDYVRRRYKGKVWKIERSIALDPMKEHYIVRVEFHLPVDEVEDEIEAYKRINRVIEVIAEGEANNVR
jgi:hypothetical protein